MKKIVLTALLFFTAMTTVSASELPQNVINKIKKEVPNANIRFDGLVEYPDGTQYLPVFPMDLAQTGTEAKVALTFPANKSLRDEPPLVLFDNNFSMLKILKSQTHNPTVIFYNEMPLCVKRGLLPQDLLVPENLVFPEELQVLLGNLVIPTESLTDEFDYFKDLDRFLEPEKALQVKKQNPLPSPQSFDKNLPCLARKMIYAINYQANGVYLVDPETGKVVAVVPLRSTPSNFLMTRDQRYLLVTMLGTPKLAVIDLTKRAVVKEIDSGLLPNSLEVDKDKNIAYIANQHSSTISIIDLENMEVKDRIEVKGAPCRLTLSQSKKELFYLDSSTDSVYVILLGEDFNDIKFLFKTKNLTKTLFINDKVFVASRDKNYITAVNGVSLKPIAQIPTGERPLDMYIYNSKIYVLNAKSDTLSVIDPVKNVKIKDIVLNSNAFPCKINLLDTPSKIIVTTAAKHEYILVDLNKESVEKKFPIDPIVNRIIVSRKH